MSADDIRKKIAALRRLARNAGASEAEAMGAAEKAAALMREHGLSDEDVEFDEQSVPVKTKGASARDSLWGMVGRCTNSGTMFDPSWTPVITFVGHAPGPEIACYLVEVLNRAVDKEIAGFKLSPEYKRRRTITTKRAAVRDFTFGLVLRLRSRLSLMFSETMSDEAWTKSREVLSLRFPQAGVIANKPTRPRFEGATYAGYRAADRVQLAHGVNGGRPVKQIGKTGS
ncbi:MAG TPA: hypothetical protein DEB47_04755 [Citreicella sp.]|nr:hypothetical protein [Citreicella sp.]